MHLLVNRNPRLKGKLIKIYVLKFDSHEPSRKINMKFNTANLEPKIIFIYNIRQ